MKKRLSRVLATVFLLLLLCIGAFFLAGGEIGLSKESLEKDLLADGHIPGHWTIQQVSSDRTTVFLYYPPEKDRYGFSVYVNRPGLSFRYFFAGSHMAASVSGSAGELSAEIREYPVLHTGDRVFLSMNQSGAACVLVNDGVAPQEIPLDPEQPFVLLFSQGSGDITFRNQSGAAVDYRSASI